jgi:SNF2 family DNA or RNA helicase
MYGATNAKDRQNLMVDFRKGDYDVLVCSEVASEGLDFEFCDTLVNYDLPWNPMKVEQRIGRLDRFGQKAEKIHILNMQVPGTIEDDIFMRLYQRIGVFENSIGELEPILRDELSSLSELALNPNLTAAQLLAEEERIRVVAENKKSDLVALKDHENLIGGVDAFLIEGFDEHTPGRGRFLGQEEIVRVVDRYFKKKGGVITFEGDSRWSFKGSQQISNEIRQLATDPVYLAKNGNSSMSPANLARQLDGSGEPFIATYSPEIAADFGLELISVKHPLLECVKRDLIESEMLLNRFGMVAIPGLLKGSEYLVSIHLARSHGLRPKLELWSTAINLQTLKVEDGPGDMLLQSFASNAFSQPKTEPDLSNVEQALEILELRVAERQLLETDVLISDNRQIKLERDAAKVIGLKNKIASSEKTLNLVTAHNRAMSIIRIHQSRLDRLNTELQETESGSSYRNPSLLIEAVALAVVVGR